MSLELVVISANILQGSIPVLSLVAHFPQWKKLVSNKSSNDISLRSWTIWTISALISIFYAVVQYYVTGSGITLVFSNISVLACVLITIYLVLLYR
ncbi:hypothetical protein AB835_00485 [Candidatus Endobugula sertula]|uniref:PQ-loop repeat-containing protein n=1 Tax=Candidatus Endobugula sertula TaxID=62101 RepID=A0A1D2QTV8_9GAMM|nr:hypothetical protein AB835_00485 [Candidatus Endobugula sertula]